MGYENVLFEVKDNVGILTINRPKVLNALNPQTLDEIGDVVEKVSKDESVRVLVITGAGDKAFVAGADISEFPKMTPLQAKIFSEKGHKVLFAIESLPIPTIACVNGYALGGGCELALACDFIYASDKAKFGQPEINLGIMPGFGGTQRLARIIGKPKAKELCMTGAQITAQEAKELGIVAQVFPHDQLFEKTMETAKALAQKSRVALRQIKQTIDRGFDVDLKTGCLLEVEAFALTFASPGTKEGTTAFLEKRKPNFKGTFMD